MQPFLVGWVMSIAFFATLAVVAVISKGRRWYELACLFLLIFLVLSLGGLAGAHWVFDVRMIELEFITLG